MLYNVLTVTVGSLSRRNQNKWAQHTKKLS